MDPTQDGNAECDFFVSLLVPISSDDVVERFIFSKLQ
jgi:hypothetical protein